VLARQVWHDRLHPARRKAAEVRTANARPLRGSPELLAPIQPAKPLITLSLGEPQHPVPDFVGPVLAKHIAEFGPLSDRQGGSSRFGKRPRTGFPGDLICRGRSIRVRASGAERQPRGAVLRGPRRRLLCRRTPGSARDPDAQSVLSGYGAGARAAGCEPVYLPTHAPGMDSCRTLTRSMMRRWPGRLRSNIRIAGKIRKAR